MEGAAIKGSKKGRIKERSRQRSKEGKFWR